MKDILKLYHRRWHWRQAGVVFVHVPKAAGTSISTALYGRFLGHYSASDIIAFDPEVLNSLPSFSVVRNPWDRALSTYRFARRPQEAEKPGQPGMRAEAKAELAPYTTFESFVMDWLRHQDINTKDLSVREQSPFVLDADGKAQVQFIGRFENLASTQEWLQNKIKMPKVFPSLNKSGPKVDYRTFYSPETRDVVRKVYARDIATFSYLF